MTDIDKAPLMSLRQRGTPSDMITASAPVGRHPDRRTTWIIVLLARTDEGAVPPPNVLLERIQSAAVDAPLVASRLHGQWWTRSSAPAITVARPGCPLESAPLRAFDLRHESPLRLVTSARRNWLLMAGHHFAFDGMGMVSVLRALLSGISEKAPDYASLDATPHSLAPAFLRLLHPADPVAPSDQQPAVDSFASALATMRGSAVTAALARACAVAVAARNASVGRPLRRIGISVAVGGVGGQGATYRRVDVKDPGEAEGAVKSALSDPSVPPEMKGMPPGAFLLQPVLQRFSDTVLVSNLGRLDLPGVRRLEFYPVARGRSALAIGAAGLVGGPTTLTLRSRTLSPLDAESLLSDIVASLPSGNGPAPSRSLDTGVGGVS
jgi:hypothetical protein